MLEWQLAQERDSAHAVCDLCSPTSLWKGDTMSINSDSTPRPARVLGSGGVGSSSGALLGAAIAMGMTNREARAA